MKYTKRKSEPASLPLAMSSPQHYLDLVKKVYPAWGIKLKSVHAMQASAACALAASAMAMGNACRISEILGIKCKDVSANGTAIIVGSKGSNARLVWLGFDQVFSEYLQTLPKESPVFPVNYQQCWRVITNLGLGVQEPSHKNISRTHGGRYELAQKTAETHGAAVAGQVLGHKSKTAVDYYTNPAACARRAQIRRRAIAVVQGPFVTDFINVEEL